jgi:hypothetical protein
MRINQRHQILECRWISVLPLCQKQSDFSPGWLQDRLRAHGATAELSQGRKSTNQWIRAASSLPAAEQLAVTAAPDAQIHPQTVSVTLKTFLAILTNFITIVLFPLSCAGSQQGSFRIRKKLTHCLPDLRTLY